MLSNLKNFHEKLLLLIILGVASLLSFRLGFPSLWIDEVFTVNYIRNDFSYLLDLGRPQERHPPGHFITLKFWSAIFGESREAVRALSVTLAVLSLPLLYVTIKPELGPQVAILATVLLGLFPGFIHFGREARMYAQLFFFLLLAIWLYSLILTPGKRQVKSYVLWGATLGFSLSLAATFYTHYTAIIYYLCFFIVTVSIAVWQRDLRLLFFGGLGLAIATIAILPQVFHMIGFIKPSDEEWIANTTFSTLYGAVSGSFPFPWWAKPIVLLLYIAGALKLLKTNKRLGVLILCFPVIGITTLALIGIWRPVLLIRTIQPFTLLTPVLLAVAITLIPKIARVPAIFFLIAIHIISLRPDYPPEREIMFVEDVAERLSSLDLSRDKVYYIEHLKQDLELFRVKNWQSFTPISFENPTSQFAEIESRFESCHKQTGQTQTECGFTFVLMEEQPLFEIKAGKHWNNFLNQLDSDMNHVSKESITGYALFFGDSPANSN